jgi:TonB family protein
MNRKTLGRSSNTTATALWVFGILSLVFHIAVFAAIGWGSVPKSVGGWKTSLSVRLSFSGPAHLKGLSTASKGTRELTELKSPLQGEAKSSPQPPATQVPAERATLQHALPTQIAVGVPPAKPQAAPDGDTEATDVAARDQESLRARVRSLLLDEFARRLTYPPLALQRGWNGRVVLSVTVDSRGILKHVHLAQSSGYEILDQSALTTMQQVQRIADAQYGFDGSDMELELPVIYRLHD